MIAYVFRFEIDPAKEDEYGRLVAASEPRLLKTPGLKEVRIYRPVTGTSQIVTMYEFDNLEGFTAWWSDAEVQKLFAELRPYQLHRDGELWGGSARFPKPLRPGG